MEKGAGCCQLSHDLEFQHGSLPNCDSLSPLGLKIFKMVANKNNVCSQNKVREKQCGVLISVRSSRRWPALCLTGPLPLAVSETVPGTWRHWP